MHMKVWDAVFQKSSFTWNFIEEILSNKQAIDLQDFYNKWGK